jgi:hypothetical protein
LNKAVTFGSIEPFNGTFFHYFTPPQRNLKICTQVLLKTVLYFLSRQPQHTMSIRPL